MNGWLMRRAFSICAAHRVEGADDNDQNQQHTYQYHFVGVSVTLQPFFRQGRHGWGDGCAWLGSEHLPGWWGLGGLNLKRTAPGQGGQQKQQAQDCQRLVGEAARLEFGTGWLVFIRVGHIFT